jgi:archaellum component FlaC
MSSQICQALNIDNQVLVSCTNVSTSRYCSDHEHKYRLQKQDCPICMEDISEINECPLNCGHWFHKNCLIQTNKESCPMCRCSFTRKETEYIFGNFEENLNNENQEVYVDYHDFTDDNFNEILPNVGPDHDPFRELSENQIETIFQEIENSPRNNTYVNVLSPFNIVHPEIEDDFQDFVENIIETVDSSYQNLNHYEGDIFLQILSNAVDRKIFAIAFHLQNLGNNNLNRRIYNLMEHSILFTYNNLL